jgi:hypothetical protein
MIENDISGSVIGAAIEVHKILEPGLLESAGFVHRERKTYVPYF